ncbi:MAG: TolB family protein [Gemmatimonadaceae bacterium]
MRDPLPPPHRSEELSRPIRLRPREIFAGVVLTAVMFAMMGYAVGRNKSSSLRDVPASRTGLMVPAIGGNTPGALTRKIAITSDGSAVIFVTGTESGGNSLASQRFDEDAARLIDGAPARLPSDVVARDGSAERNSSLFSRLRPDDREDPGGKALEGLRFQQMLPDRRTALAIRPEGGAASGAAVAVQTQTGERRVIVDERVVEIRAAEGHLVYVRDDGTLWAAPFDDETLELTDPPTRIGQGVSLTGTGIAQFAVARNGNVAYVPEEPRWLVFIDRNGRLRNATSERAGYRSPRFSPDDSRVSVDFTGSGGRDIWILSRDTRSLSRATFTRDAHDAEWTPDGRRLTFTSFSTGSLGVFETAPGTISAPRALFTSPLLSYTGAWLPDGSGLITVAQNLRAGSRLDIAFIADEGRGPLEPIIADNSRAQYPALSHDGRWLAYVSNRSGTDQVYVRPWRGGGPDVAVSQNGGTEPVWSPDGRELYYRGTNGRYPVLIAATVSTTRDFTVTNRTGLFPIGDIAQAAPQANYDISPDGRTFVMVRLAQSNEITVLRNLPEIVRKSGGSR